MHTKSWIDKISIFHILSLGLFLRLLAAFFSQGYSHHDDHFLVVEVAQSWIDGKDVADWFVTDYAQNTSGRSVLYPGFYFVVFKGLQVVGIDSVATKMLIIRILQAFYALLVIWFGYKITQLFGSEKQAKFVAIICAILWIMPNISVRSLTEVAAIPPLLMASFYTLQAIKNKNNWVPYLISGSCFGIAFSLRYQTAIFAFGFVLGLLLLREWKAIIGIAFSGMAYFIVFHGYGDYLMCGRWFGKVIYYIAYNLQFSSEYIKLPWYNHLLAIAGFLVPPAGVFLLIGSFRWVKEYAPIYLGVLLFLILHSAMQGKQERFMYTMFPFYIIIGYVGWCSISDKITWQKWKKVERLIWIFAALVNGIALLFLSTWYGKKARVEAMIYMQDKPIVAAIVANEELDNNHMLPRAYSGQWFDVIEYRAQFNFDDFSKQLSASNQKPNYLFFEVAPTSENHKLHARWRTLFPKIKLEKRIEGSIMDKWHYKANPVVKNFDYVIYKLEGSK